MKKHYIYKLCDSITSEVKYVGRSENLTNRYNEHISPISEKEKWIHDLRMVGEQPKLEVIECVENNLLAAEREQYWIEFYGKTGKLLNGKSLTYFESYDKIEIPIGSTLEAAEYKIIKRTMEFCRNNKTRAAKILGIALKTLYNKLENYNL